MHKIITRTLGVGAALAVGLGAMAATAPSASAASHVGTATVKEGRKVVREADRQRCLTLKETRKIVHGTGSRDANPGTYYWYAKGRAEVLIVEYSGGCAVFSGLQYDNGDTATARSRTARIATDSSSDSLRVGRSSAWAIQRANRAALNAVDPETGERVLDLPDGSGFWVGRRRRAGAPVTIGGAGLLRMVLRTQ